MEFGELVIIIDSSQSCVLQLPMSVIYGMLLINTVRCITKRLGQVFSYALHSKLYL